MSKPAIRPRAALVAAAVALGILAAAATALPTAANAGAVQLIVSQSTGRCLDSNAVGQVYLNPCNSSNPYQQWERWEWGWAKNHSTGRCLSHAGVAGVATDPCDQNAPWQWYRHWQDGWFQRPAYQLLNMREPAVETCLEARNSTAVRYTGCGNPNNPSLSTVWHATHLFYN